MSPIPLELPEELLSFVEEKVRKGRFTSANEYIVALVSAARNQRSAIEVALIEGLESGPAEEWTHQQWSELKHRIVERHRES